MQFNTVADTDDTVEQNCASNRKNESLLHFTIDVMSNVCMTFLEYSNTGLSFGHIASVLGSVVLMFVITSYFLMCVFTRFYTGEFYRLESVCVFFELVS